MTYIKFRIPTALKKLFKKYCEKNKITMSEFIINKIKEKL